MIIKDKFEEIPWDLELKIRRYIIRRNAISLVAIVEPQPKEILNLVHLRRKYGTEDGPLDEVVPMEEVDPNYTQKGSYVVIRVV